MSLEAPIRSQSFLATAPPVIKRAPCYRCAPSLLLEGDVSVFNPSCALTLAALADEDFTGRWSVSNTYKDSLWNEIQEFSRTSMQKADPPSPMAAMSQKLRSLTGITGDKSKTKSQVKSEVGTELPERKGAVSLKELECFLDDEDNRERVRLMPNALHGILKQSMMREGFHHFTKDNSNMLEFSEWSNFLDRLAFLHMKYLLAEAMLDFRAFFGRGQQWELDPTDNSMEKLKFVLQQLARKNRTRNKMILSSLVVNVVVDGSAVDCAKRTGNGYTQVPSTQGGEEQNLSTFQVGRDYDANEGSLLAAGWWKDLYYYSANNHPLHGIVACDKFHPLSWIERLMMELATFGMAFFTLWLEKLWVGHEKRHSVVLFSLVVVTIPGIILWWVLFLLFTCRCSSVSEAHATRDEMKQHSRLGFFAEAIGHLLVLLGIGFLGYGLHGHQELVWPALFGRSKSYIFAWFMMIFVYFNPVIAWGQPNAHGGFCLGDLIGLGQWRIEKQKFQHMCILGVSALETHDIRYKEIQSRKTKELAEPIPKRGIWKVTRSVLSGMLPRWRPRFLQHRKQAELT